MRRAALEAGPPTYSFAGALARPGLSFICEVKKASPSKGVIAADFPYLEIARDYAAAGADALSVLTEPEFFLGDPGYLREIAAEVGVPVLRKDFVVDPYQIDEARVLGAAAVLLIVALLGPDLPQYVARAHDVGLTALVEVHSAAELDLALSAGALVIGVNHRDLRTFDVDLGLTERLRPAIPPDHLVVAESGVQTAADVRRLKDAGVNALLIGETLMRSNNKRDLLQEWAAA
jgi:indole-3-glycerol phosphate synthase